MTAKKKNKKEICLEDFIIRESDDINTIVKKRLAEWKYHLDQGGAYSLNWSRMVDAMSLKYNINTTDKTLRSIFDLEEKARVSMEIIVALSELINYPLAMLCAIPGDADIDTDPDWLRNLKPVEKTGIINLQDDFYRGKYSGYFFEPKHYDRTELNRKNPVHGSKLKKVDMEIKDENGETVVVMKETDSQMNFFETDFLPNFEWKGRLNLLENVGIAYSFLLDANGRRAAFLMFEYQKYHKDILYYRTAAMMTFSLNEKHLPLFQKIVMLRVEQDISVQYKEDIIRGLLSLNSSNPILIEKEYFDKEVENIEYSLKDIKKDVLKEKAFYVFSESDIRENESFNWDNEETIKNILKLREMSIYPAHEIVYEPEYLRTFIRKQMKL